MAGNFRPEKCIGKKELVLDKDIIVNYANGYMSDNSFSALFDGNMREGNGGGVFMWCGTYGDAPYYTTLIFNKSCRLWRYPSTTLFNTASSKFRILKVDNGITDISSQLIQPDLPVDAAKWAVSIEELPAGTYIFDCAKQRVDSEWFLEDLDSRTYILQSNSELFIPNEDNYDSSTGLYTPISSIPSNFTDLYTDDLLSTPDYFIDQTKKVIDLFDSDIRIIKPTYEAGDVVTLNGIKSTREMVVASGDINNGVAQSINSIVVNNTVSDNSTLKLALSIDSGETWLTHDAEDWQPLDIIIPKTGYSSLSESELSQWNSARDTIFNNGIDISLFNTLDFNALTDTLVAPNTIRFAYVLDRPSYADKVSTNSMVWNFDGKGSMKKMKDDEYDIDLYEHQIRFTSLIDNAMLITNVII